MSALTPPVRHNDPLYPDSDGQPMADNTLQFQWIVTIKENLELLFEKQPDVFVAGDLLWYPVEYHPEIRAAPDALVVFGRPKGYRGSYKQWLEDGIAPHVVFEVLSPGNRAGEMNKKRKFYEDYGVEEYYVYDPDSFKLKGWLREETGFREIKNVYSWTSPRLQIRFELPVTQALRIYRPDGERFLTFVELGQLVAHERLQTERALQQAEQERQRAEQEHQRAEQERQRAERLALRLKALGLDPE